MTAEEYISTHPTLQNLEAYFVATPYNRINFNLSPYGVKIKEQYLVDPTRSETERFCDLLLKLDSITFGPEGMPMDKWVFYDVCYMPGAVMGFGIPAHKAPEELRQLFNVDANEQVLIPLSMYGTIPMTAPRSWMGHNLSSIGKRVTFRSFKGLGTLSKVLGLKVVQARDFFGATQWNSVALNVHAKFGPLRLYTAYTPAHTEKHTLTYGFKCNDRSLLAAAGHPDYAFERPTPDLWINPNDEAGMINLQDRLEAGEYFCIPSAPKYALNDQSEVPVSLVSGNFFNS